MFITRILVFILTFVIVHAEPVDYKALVDNIRIDYWNTNLAAANSSFKLFKYNRTQLAVNVSIWVLQDLDGRKIESATKVWYYSNNAFKFSGFALKVPSACKMWEDDLYGIRGIMSRCGGRSLCDIKKGLYHLDNCWPVESVKYFPKSLPQASYKVTMESRIIDGPPLVTIAWYGKTSLYFKEMNKKQDSF